MDSKVAKFSHKVAELATVETAVLPTLAGVSKLELGADQARRKLKFFLNKLGYKLDF